MGRGASPQVAMFPWRPSRTAQLCEEAALRGGQGALTPLPSARGLGIHRRGRWLSCATHGADQHRGDCRRPSRTRAYSPMSVSDNARRPGYSITSTARSNSSRGIATPSAFAVLRLMVKSNLWGCCMGRSARNSSIFPLRQCRNRPLRLTPSSRPGVAVLISILDGDLFPP